MYTEHQKKLTTSLECHPLISKASTWIIFGHDRLGKFILNKHIAKKQKFTLIIEEIHVCDEIARGQLKKSQKLLASRAGISKQTKADTAFTSPGHPPLKLNVLNRLPPWSSLRARWPVSSFCDFRKIAFRDLTAFSPSWHEKIFLLASLILQPIFFRFSLLCLKMFTLYSEI